MKSGMLKLFMEILIGNTNLSSIESNFSPEQKHACIQGIKKHDRSYGQDFLSGTLP